MIIDKKKKRKKQTTFFHPDEISTRISEETIRDLRAPLQMYGVPQYALEPFLVLQQTAILKKYNSLQNTGDSDLCRDAALKKFMAVNKHMTNFSESGLNLPDLKADNHYRSQVLRSARSIIRMVLTPMEEDEYFSRCKNSSGVSRGVPFAKTEIEGKFTFPITGNERVETLVTRYLQFNPFLAASIEEFNRQQGNHSPKYLKTNESRATTVPKNNKIDRFISIEPTWNMFFQQGLMECMYDRLAAFGLDVRFLPDIQKERALKGR